MSTPKRIVSLLSAGTEILYGLGLGEHVVAVGHECDWPEAALAKPRVTHSYINAMQSSGDIDAQVHELYAAGRPLYGIDMQQLIDLRPDLIVTQAQCEVCAVSYDEVLSLVRSTPQLEQTSVVGLNPTGLTEVLTDIRRISQAAGVPASGERYSAELSQRIDSVRERTSNLSPQRRPRVACIEWLEPIMLAGNWVPDLLQIAGGTSLLTSAGKHSPYVTWEAICELDPEVIIISPCGFDLDRTADEARTLTALPGWTNVTAVRSQRVYGVDGNALLNRSGPRLVDSIEVLAHLLHPQLFAEPTVSGLERAWMLFD